MLRSASALIISSFCFTMACMPHMPQYGSDEGSQTKDVNINVPKLEAFSADKALQEKITGYKLTVSSKDEKCHHKDPYVSKIVEGKISATILKACDYEITVEFGKLSDDSLTLPEAYFAGEAALSQAEIAQQTANGSASVGLEILVSATELGKAAGFAGEVKLDSATLDVSVKVQNHTQPTDDITGFAEKYTPSKSDLSEYGKAYITLMNKIEHVSNNDQLKYAQYAEYLKGKVFIFDGYLSNVSFSDPSYKSFRFAPVIAEADARFANGLGTGVSYELMTSTKNLDLFQPLYLKFKDLKDKTLMRVKVRIKEIGFLGTKISAELLEAEVVQ